MPTRTQFIGVMFFLLCGVGAMSYMAYVVSGEGVPGTGDTITVFARFSDVANLGMKARVKLAGVTVGRVAGISIDRPHDAALVTMHIERYAMPLASDTRARIVSEGVVGSRYIALYQGQQAQAVADGGTLVRTEGAVVLETLVTRIVDGYAQPR